MLEKMAEQRVHTAFLHELTRLGVWARTFVSDALNGECLLIGEPLPKTVGSIESAESGLRLFLLVPNNHASASGSPSVSRRGNSMWSGNVSEATLKEHAADLAEYIEFDTHHDFCTAFHRALCKGTLDVRMESVESDAQTGNSGASNQSSLLLRYDLGGSAACTVPFRLSEQVDRTVSPQVASVMFALGKDRAPADLIGLGPRLGKITPGASQTNVSPLRDASAVALEHGIAQSRAVTVSVDGFVNAGNIKKEGAPDSGCGGRAQNNPANKASHDHIRGPKVGRSPKRRGGLLDRRRAAIRRKRGAGRIGRVREDGSKQ